MKVQQTVSAKYGKKYVKLNEAITALDSQVIVLGDAAVSENTAKDFAKEYKTFAKLAAKLAALVGE
jgi:hypothetical protein